MEYLLINYPGILAKFTRTQAEDWREVPGPKGGYGLDYWYRNVPEGLLAYVNLDQEILCLSVNCQDDCDRDDGFEGDLSQFAEFVQRRPSPPA